MYCDDVDFSWRVRLLGYKVIYRSDAPVFHAEASFGGWTMVPHVIWGVLLCGSCFAHGV